MEDSILTEEDCRLADKLNWVHDICSDKAWRLTDKEKQQLIGAKSVANLDGDNKTLEIMCDCLHRIQLTLDNVYDDPTFQAEARWLRTPIMPFDGLSPLNFVDGKPALLKEVEVMLPGERAA